MKGSWHTSKPLRTHCHIDARQIAQGKAASRPITKPNGRAINDNSTIPILIAPNSSPVNNAHTATDTYGHVENDCFKKHRDADKGKDVKLKNSEPQ